VPTLLSETEVKLEWSDLATRKPRRERVLVRASGDHLKAIVVHALSKAGLLDCREDDFGPLYAALGVAWEYFAVSLYPDMDWQPGEVEKDGVFGNPDGLSLAADGSGVLEEFKLTWKSRRPHEESSVRVCVERQWMWQLSGYLYMMGLTRARLHVFYVNGDYRPPRPRYFVYEIEFDKADLARFWQNVVLTNRETAPKEEH